MADYIDRTTAINVAQNPYHVWNLAMATADDESEINLVHSGQELCNAVERVFKIAPPADVAPVRHARWKSVIGSNNRCYMVCSRCWKQQDLTGVFSYCPDCGAKMDGDADDEV